MEKKNQKNWVSVRRKLDDKMITVHARPAESWSITFNQSVCEKTRVLGFKFASIKTLDGFGLGKLAVVLSNNPDGANVTYCKNCMVVCSKDIVTRITSHFGLTNGSYYMKIMQIPDPTKQKLTLMIERVISPFKVLESKEYNEISVKADSIDMKPVFNPLSTASDEDLLEELKNRGYNGTIRKEYSL